MQLQQQIVQYSIITVTPQQQRMHRGSSSNNNPIRSNFGVRWCGRLLLKTIHLSQLVMMVGAVFCCHPPRLTFMEKLVLEEQKEDTPQIIVEVIALFAFQHHSQLLTLVVVAVVLRCS